MTPPHLLQSKIAWITGGLRTTGLGIADKMRAEGYDVRVFNRPNWDLGMSSDDLFTAMRSALELASEDGELPSVFIHNSGTMGCDWIEEASLKQFEYIMHVNLEARFTINKALVSAISIRPEHKLRIIHVVSVAANFPLRTSSAYCASKAADAMLVRQLAKELTGRYDNIRIFGVSPNGIQGSGMIAQAVNDLMRLRGMSKEQAIAYNTQSPMGRLCTASEVADIVHFLAEDAPEYMTGEIVTMPGGMPV